MPRSTHRVQISEGLATDRKEARRAARATLGRGRAFWCYPIGACVLWRSRPFPASQSFALRART